MKSNQRLSLGDCNKIHHKKDSSSLTQEIK